MGIALNTAGILLKYAVEATAGTRPTTGYTVTSPDVTGIPDLDPAPNSIDVTTLAETEWMQYIPGLKDPGGAITFSALNTNAMHTDWDETLVEAAETAKAAGKRTWFEIEIPGLTKAFYFAGEPAKLGLAAAEVNAALTINCNITPTQIVGWAAKPTA